MQVFPENLPALQLMQSLLTQWRCGFSGPTGLDYTAVPVVMALQGVKKKQQAGVFTDLQVMEAEMLKVWREQRAADK